MKKFILSTTFIASIALAGSFAGNGTDVLPISYRTMWFNNPQREVTWCVNIADPLVKIRVERLMRQAYQSWLDYIALKLSSGNNKIEAAKLSLNSSCGQENDLEIYSGTEGNFIKSDLDLYKGALSFSRRLVFQNDWGRGYIWISDAIWLDEMLLSTQLFHQFGHVMGNSHIQGTIMDEKFSTQSAPRLSIDLTREVFRCLPCGMKISGKSGQVKSSFSSRSDNGGTLLTLSYEQIHQNFTLGEMISSNSVNNDTVFGRNVNGSYWGLPSESQVYSVKSSKGPGILELGMDKYVRLFSIERGEYKLLFESDE